MRLVQRLKALSVGKNKNAPGFHPVEEVADSDGDGEGTGLADRAWCKEDL